MNELTWRKVMVLPLIGSMLAVTEGRKVAGKDRR